MLLSITASIAAAVLLAGCGASKDMKASFAQMQKISGLMTTAFETFFHENSQILSTLKKALSPIVAAGPTQQGFAPERLAAMNTASTEDIARQQNNAKVAAAARGGSGASDFVPSGATAALQTGIDVAAGNAAADARRQNTLAGYEAGRQNFFGATEALGVIPGQLENPVSSAALRATEANTQQFSQADTINKMSGWFKPVLGAVTSGALGALTGGVTSLANKGLAKLGLGAAKTVTSAVQDTVDRGPNA